MRAIGFYPSNRDELKGMLDNFVKADHKKGVGGVVPHAGYVFSGSVAGKVYGNLEKKKRIIVIGPNHWGVETFVDTGVWRTPLGKVELDEEFIKNLDMPKHDSMEHSIEVQVPFLQYVFRDFKLVPIVVGRMDEDEINNLARVLTNKESLYIASSDFIHYGPHYGYEPAGSGNVEWVRNVDQKLIQAICNMDENSFFLDISKNHYTVCGFVPITLVVKILKNVYKNIKGILMDYKTSHEVQPSDSFVSYTGIVFVQEQ